MTIERGIRKDVLDWLRVEGVSWSGRLSEEAFLDRVVDLDALSSTDSRFRTARQDIRQHRVNNPMDWDDDWVFSYEPLALMKAPDDVFLSFLSEMIHPVVRPDADEARGMAHELNDLLRRSDVELFESGAIGQRPVWSVRTVSGGLAPSIERTSSTSNSDGSERIWGRAKVRLFLSHVAEHKLGVSRLKQELSFLGVSAFVAHEDIEPGAEWQDEIELALRSMDVMAALLTPDFHGSKWTDQEIGYALGRGVLVLPIRLPDNPYGFIGKHQAMKGRLDAPENLAYQIAETLLRRPETASNMREALVLALEASASFGTTRALSKLMRTVTTFTEAQIGRIAAAISANDQVGHYSAISYLSEHVAALKVT